MNRQQAHAPLLTAADPPPVEVVNGASGAPLVLLCEHAGQAIPEALGSLGLEPGVIGTHRGWDIGAEALARRVAAALEAPLIIQRYSRLVADCNRPPESADFAPAEVDGAAIPGNRAISDADRAARRAAIFDPMNDTLDAAFDGAARRAAFSVHSFTPEFGGEGRPWHAGFLTRHDIPTAERMLAHVAAEDPSLTLALNQPYQIDGVSDWFIPAHAEARGLAHTLIEVRNDQLRDEAGIDRWAEMLTGAIGAVMETQT